MVHHSLIDVFYMESKLLDVGVDINQTEGVNVKILNRDRTVCDILRHENKIEREVFTSAIQRYIKDPEKDIKKLLEYSKVLNLKNKV